MKKPKEKKVRPDPDPQDLEDADLDTVVGGAMSPAIGSFDPQPEPPGRIDRLRNIVSRP
jgi:hypothetical protein